MINTRRLLKIIVNRRTISGFLAFYMLLTAFLDPTQALATAPDRTFCLKNDILWSCGTDCSTAGSSAAGKPTTPSSTGAVDETGWAFPAQPGTPITSDYKAADRPGHKGVDLGAPMGSPIYASKDGTVIASGPATGFGHWIVIQHEVDGKRVDSVYGHMYEQDLMVHVGDKVTAGQQIARVGNDGTDTTGAHLHYEEWDGGRGDMSGGTERKPVAVYGQTGQTTPGAATPVANNNGASQSGSQCSSSSSTTAPNCADAANSPDKSKFVFDYLRSQGLDDTHAAALMGNFAHESGDPTFEHSTDAYEQGGANAGYGIAQWSFGRQPALRDAAASQGKDVKDLCFQLDYAVQEAKGMTRRDGEPGNVWDGFQQTQSLHDAVYFIEYNYEKPAPGSTSSREHYAQQYLDKYGGKSS